MDALVRLPQSDLQRLAEPGVKVSLLIISIHSFSRLYSERESCASVYRSCFIINKNSDIMKFQLLDLPFCTKLRENGLTQVQIIQTKRDSQTEIRSFLSNHGITKNIPKTEKTFLCEYNNNGIKEIVGIFSFSDEDIRTKIPNIGNDPISRNYHRLCLLVIDHRLIVKSFLSRAFMIILPLMIDKNDSSEVFWFYYGGILYSRVTESLAKNHPYYMFKNESDYFADMIIKLMANKK